MSVRVSICHLLLTYSSSQLVWKVNHHGTPHRQTFLIYVRLHFSIDRALFSVFQARIVGKVAEFHSVITIGLCFKSFCINLFIITLMAFNHNASMSVQS